MVMLHLSFFSWMNQTLSQQRDWWEEEMNTKEVSNFSHKKCLFQGRVKYTFKCRTKALQRTWQCNDAYEKKIFVEK